MSTARPIARLKVAPSEVEPPVMRRLDVSPEVHLRSPAPEPVGGDGWTDSHLYLFGAAGVSWGEPDKARTKAVKGLRPRFSPEDYPLTLHIAAQASMIENKKRTILFRFTNLSNLLDVSLLRLASDI